MRLPLRPLWAAPFALLAVLTGCNSQPTLAAPDLSGHYTGFGGGYTWEVDLTQSGGALSGSGTLTTASGEAPLAVTVDGAYTYPVVGLSLDVAPLGLFTFDGHVTNGGDVLTGTVESADGFNASTSFQRQ